MADIRSTSSSEMTRRTFMASGAATVAAAGLLTPGTLWAETPSKDKPAKKGKPLARRKLGRTGLQVTDIAFGGIQITRERLLDVAIDRGINYIHTSPGYGGGTSIQLFGKVMRRRRNEVYLALKKNPIGGIDEQLKILNTDHVDVLVPPLHTVEAMNDERLPEAYEKLKKEGKIRFSGYACHKNISEVMARSVDLGFFDVMLIAYNLANRDELDPILARAVKEQNMGFMAMKTTKDLDRSSREGMVSGLTALLKNPHVHTLLVGMGSFAEVETNVSASGRSLGLMDRLRLMEPARVALDACTMCGACDVCPEGVAVSDILRYRLYHDRGETGLAVSGYRSLPGPARYDACTDCGRCEQVCPRALGVRQALAATHAALA